MTVSFRYKYSKNNRVYIGCFYQDSDFTWFFPIKRSPKYPGFEGYWYDPHAGTNRWVYSDFVMDLLTDCKGVEPKSVPLHLKESLREIMEIYWLDYI